MSERTHAPRSGGRTAEQGMTGRGRDADTRRSDARGARHFTTGDDTRRSGIGRDAAGKPATRAERGETAQPRVRVRDTEGVRAQRAAEGVRGTRRTSEPESASDEIRRQTPARGVGRRPEPAVGRDRSTGPVAGRERTTGGIAAQRDRKPQSPAGRARKTDAPEGSVGRVAGRDRVTGSVGGRDRVTGSVGGRDRVTGSVGGRDRVTGSVGGRDRVTGSIGGRDRTGGSLAGQDRDPVAGRGTTAAPAFGKRAGRIEGGRVDGGRGRRPVTDAPVDGTAALDIQVAEAEPIRHTGEVGGRPRLRVAPPAPINAPRAPFVATVIGLVVVGVLGILLINTKTNENSFRIDDLKNQDAALDNQQQDLKNQLVEASSIGNLDAAARRLGLVKATNPALIVMPDGSFIGVLTPANGRPAVTAPDAKKADEPTGKTAGADTTAGNAAGANGQNAAGANGQNVAGVDGQNAAGANGQNAVGGSGQNAVGGTGQLNGATATQGGNGALGGAAPAGTGQ
jgi:hypothetical protein